MGKILLNGIEYSGLSVINGLFIDTANVITSGTITAGSSISYTATADCAFDFLAYSSGGSNAFLQIDGKNIFTSSAGTNRNTFLVKKGQTVTVGSYGTNGSYTVCGLMQGSSGGSYEHIYSTTERVIGKWIDNKPIYEQVLPMTQAFNCTVNTWVETEFPKGTKKALFKAVIVNDAGAVIDSLSSGFVNNKVALNSPRAFNISANTASLILQYTKTTD